MLVALPRTRVRPRDRRRCRRRDRRAHPRRPGPRAPLTDLDAEEMVHSLATFPLLDGFRGAPKKDVAALVDVILRVSQLADHHRRSSRWTATPSWSLPATP